MIVIEIIKNIIRIAVYVCICFTIICILDIQAYLKKKKKPIYEFDCELPGSARQHISVLEKFQHHFSAETFRRLRVEYTFSSDIDGVCYGAYETIVDERDYVELLKNSIDPKEIKKGE